MGGVSQAREGRCERETTRPLAPVDPVENLVRGIPWLLLDDNQLRARVHRTSSQGQATESEVSANIYSQLYTTLTCFLPTGPGHHSLLQILRRICRCFLPESALAPQAVAPQEA